MHEPMRRRAILVASGAWLLAAPISSLAQAPNPTRRIAVLLPGTQSGYRSRFEAFRAELKKLGYVEGRDILIEARWAENKTEMLASLAAEMVALGPAVILTGSSAGVIACKKATSTIPIVFASAGSPVEQGFVSSLQRPGGNITGIMRPMEFAAKIVEVTREALPQVQRLAILVHESDPIHKLILDLLVPTARRFKFEPLVFRVTGADGLAHAFDEMVGQRADAVYLPDLAFNRSHHRELVDRSFKARLPLLSGHEEITAAGGLLSYGTPPEENYRRAAALMDKILRGAKPGDLPVEQPQRFELVVNLKTAKAIGVTLSPVTMLRATKVID